MLYVLHIMQYNCVILNYQILRVHMYFSFSKTLFSYFRHIITLLGVLSRILVIAAIFISGEYLHVKVIVIYVATY